MPAPRFMLSATFVAILIGSAGADKKAATNKEMIVGTWELAEAPKGYSFSITMEFTKESKLKLQIKDNSDSTSESAEATYLIDGDKIITTWMDGGKDTDTIVTLTDKVLVLAVEKQKDGTFKEATRFKRR